MAIPAVFTWPIPDTQAISLTQTLGAAGNLLINGNLALNSSVILQGIGRTVSLTSTNDLSAVMFTITGTRYGRPVIASAVTGPNNDTVETTGILFDTISSISTDGAVTAVSAGTGTSGETDWYNFNYHATFPSLAVQVVVTGTIDYTFQVTLDDVQTNGAPTAFSTFGNLTGASDDQIAFGTLNFRYANILINNSTGASLVATLLQSGIT